MVLTNTIDKTKECPACRNPQVITTNKLISFRRKTLYTYSWRRTKGYQCSCCGYFIELIKKNADNQTKVSNLP